MSESDNTMSIKDTPSGIAVALIGLLIVMTQTKRKTKTRARSRALFSLV